MARHKEKRQNAAATNSNSRKNHGSELVQAKKQARVKRIQTAEDAGFSGEDAFGMGDDEVRLDGGRRRAGNGNDNNLEDTLDDLDPNEVLSLNLSTRGYLDGSVSEGGEQEDLSTEVAPSKKLQTRLKNRDRDLAPLTDARTSRFERPVKAAKRNVPAETDSQEDDSDAEPAGKATSDDDDNDADKTVPENEFVEDWATAGGYHVSKREIARAEDAQGGKSVDEREQQRDALELYEARQIQRQTKEDLGEDDYGLGEEDDSTPITSLDPTSLASKPMQPALSKFASREEAIAHLVSSEPELLALLDDLSASSDRLTLVKSTVKAMHADLAPDNPKIGFGYLYQETLTAYLTTLVFYLHVRSHPAYSQNGCELASAALSKLVKLREAVSTLDNLGVLDLPGEEKRMDMYQDGESNSEDGDNDLALEEMDREALLARIADLDDDELDALIRERQGTAEQDGLPTGKSSKRKAITYGDDVKESRSTRSRKRKRDSASRPQTDLLNLAPVPYTARTSAPLTADSDLLDPTTLSNADAEEKAGRSKSLRFYTSKIDAKSAKRSGAGKERAGGDDDVPYRSKERARAAMLQRQQHNQQKALDEKVELDDDEFGEGDLHDARAVVADPDAEGYYDLVSKGKRAAKAAKKEAYDAAVEEDRAAFSTAQPLDPNNPRAVNRMIMANKGLTPKRPKSVRNPRVKKRMRYDKAQKKVASMKPVYKGGLGSGSYEGEKSGISSRVVKSRAL